LAAALVTALTFAGCQDGYPIAATRCDHLCELTKVTQCESYNPAGCVVTCEGASDSPICDPLFDDLLICLRAHKNELFCNHTGQVMSCGAEQQAHRFCLALNPPAHAQKSSE
jgi:hypothetical protein